MEKISDLLPTIETQKKTNRLYLIAEEISAITKEKPNRYLRMVKQNEHACRRAIDNLKELSPRNPAAYFLWLYREYSQS